MPYKSLALKYCEFCGKEIELKIQRDEVRKKYCNKSCRQKGRFATGEFHWLSKMQQSRRLLNRETPAHNSLLASYKRHAATRNLPWELTDYEFGLMTKSPCWYTWRLPSNIYKGSGGSTYIYNGIDRLDNSKGYTISNCVPCCSEINYAKRSLTLNQFLDLIYSVGVCYPL